MRPGHEFHPEHHSELAGQAQGLGTSGLQHPLCPEPPAAARLSRVRFSNPSGGSKGPASLCLGLGL